jgi:hypothetical protein
MSDLMDYTDPMDIPNLTEDQLFAYLRDELGVPVARRTVKWAVINREIHPTRIGRRNVFSRADGINWLESLKTKS